MPEYGERDLSDAQARAMAELTYEWQREPLLRARPQTLDSLVKYGLVEKSTATGDTYFRLNVNEV